MDHSYLAANLTHLRSVREWPLEWVAREAGLSEKDLESFEQSSCDPPVTHLRNLCKLFDVGIDDLLFRDLRAQAPAVDELIDNCREHAQLVNSLKQRYNSTNYIQDSLDDSVNLLGRSIKSLLEFSDEVIPLLEEVSMHYRDVMEDMDSDEVPN